MIWRAIQGYEGYGRSKTAGRFLWSKVDKCNDYLGYESTVEDELPPEALDCGIPTEDIV